MQNHGTWTGVTTGTQSVTDAQRLAGVPSALAGAEASLSSLASSVSMLHDRLEKAGVLLPSPPQAASGSSQPVPPNFQTSLANGVDRLRGQANMLTAAISDLIERVDL